MIPDALTIKGKVNMESASNVVAAGWASLIRVFLSIIGKKISLKIALKKPGQERNTNTCKNTCKITKTIWFLCQLVPQRVKCN